jgi:hypothetical protein
VSGKGIPAALLMGVLHGAVRSSSWTDSREHTDQILPSELAPFLPGQKRLLVRAHLLHRYRG